MNSSQAQQNAIVAAENEIDKVEEEISKASKKGESGVIVSVPRKLYDTIEAYLKNNGFEIELSYGDSEIANIAIKWF